MEAELDHRTDAFNRLIDAWRQGDPADVLTLITADYNGRLLEVEHGQRSAAQYPGWIQAFREANPSTRFHIQDQSTSLDRPWTRLRACRGDGAVSHGMTISRFADDRIAEEWAIWSGWAAADDDGKPR